MKVKFTFAMLEVGFLGPEVGKMGCCEKIVEKEIKANKKRIRFVRILFLSW